MKQFDTTWRFGANFYPSSAINQLEMWQSDTFDLPRIERELQWAAGIGMSLMRVYLHDLLYVQDAAGFLNRMDQYLAAADRNGIKTMFVFFDDCWRSEFALGKQPDPIPFTHNSGWIQSPGSRVADDPSQWGRLETYVKAVLKRFGDDPRVLLWDLYNEPGNGSAGDHVTQSGMRGELSLPLLKAVFEWAADAAPSQPVTVGAWRFAPDFDQLNDFIFAHSEVVSFHCYENPAATEERIKLVESRAAGRPIVCSEYMARPTGSTFAGCLPLFRKHNISAINWGLVSGKTQTIYPWGWDESKGVPPQWFHDVFNADGTLLYPEEKLVFDAVMR